jgi:hypothetical protein
MRKAPAPGIPTKKEAKRMPLYLDEIYFNVTSPDDVKKGVALIQRALKEGFPPGVTLKAGPWGSNEEAKIILVLDIQDHSLTFNPFAKIVGQGLVAKRRLTPIVEWSAVEKAAAEM